MVSTIVPGPDTEATFYSGENLNGLKHTFTDKIYDALTSFHYPGSSSGNDEANSIFVSSSVNAKLPKVLCTRAVQVVELFSLPVPNGGTPTFSRQNNGFP